MAVVAWGIQHANDVIGIVTAANPVAYPSLKDPNRGFRLGGSAALGDQQLALSREHGAQHREHLGARVGAEPPPDPRDVVLDGLGGDEQLTADVAIRHAE